MYVCFKEFSLKNWALVCKITNHTIHLKSDHLDLTRDKDFQNGDRVKRCYLLDWNTAI